MKAGYAQLRYIPPTMKYAELFQKLHGEAVELGGGLWKDKDALTRLDLPNNCVEEKISFDILKLDDYGLVGPWNGKVSVDYEFCIPYTDESLLEVKKIEPDIQCDYGPKGRIGCNDNEYLCLSGTGFKDFKTILCDLSQLDYVKRIDQNFWE